MTRSIILSFKEIRYSSGYDRQKEKQRTRICHETQLDIKTAWMGFYVLCWKLPRFSSFEKRKHPFPRYVNEFHLNRRLYFFNGWEIKLLNGEKSFYENESEALSTFISSTIFICFFSMYVCIWIYTKWPKPPELSLKSCREYFPENMMKDFVDSKSIVYGLVLELISCVSLT